MGRRLAPHPATLATRPQGTVALRSYPASQPDPPPLGLLQVPLATETQPQRSFRQRFGRSISLDRIESALRSAYRGGMRDLTDLSRETIDTDPHLASVLNKRFRAVSGLPWEIHPATGPGINTDKAAFYAAVCRDQIRSMEAFRATLLQMAWAMFDGRSCHELNWIEFTGESTEFGQALMAIASTTWVHPRRLSFGPQRELRIQDEAFMSGGNFSSAGMDVRIIPYKFAWWLPQMFSEYPEREGIAQRCLYWSFFKRFAARERMILLELFGKPWRILQVDNDSNAQAEDLTDGDAVIDSLGGSFTARLPRGTKLDVVSPIRGAGQVHQEVITESDRQLSKLVLGQTGTTDGVPSGLNNQQANVMQDEQLMILAADAEMMSENIETRVTDPIIAVNFGREEVSHAPHFVLRADRPADRNTEITRLDSSLKAGLEISRAEAYEVSGFRVPAADEITIRMEQPPTPPNSPVAPAVRPVVVFPTGQSPEAGEQQPAPTQAGEGAGAQEETGAPVGAADAAKTIKMNEARAAQGLPPMTLPDGSLDPDGELTVEEYNAKHLAIHGPAPTPAQPAASGGAVGTAEDLPGPVEIAAARLQARGALDPIAAHNAGVLLQIMKAPSAELVSDPFAGEGGVHTHGLNREQLTTAVDGEHQHVFKMPDGRLMMTEFDGAHPHTIASADADDIGTGGEHMHAIRIDGMTGQTGFEASSHGHVLQVFETGLDGPHVHTLPIRNPVSGIDETIVSLTSGQFAALLAEMAAVQIVDQVAPHSPKVTTPVGSNGLSDLGNSSPVVQVPVGASRRRARARRSPASTPSGDRDDGDTEPRRRFFSLSRTAAALPSDPRDIAGQALAMLDRKVDAPLALALTEAVYQDRTVVMQLHQWRHSGCCHGVMCAADQNQPDSVFGNVETLLGSALPAGYKAVAKIAAAYKRKVKGQTTAAGIHAALNMARASLNLNELASTLERKMIQALALGALDSAAETALDDPSIGEERIEDVVERGGEISEILTSRFHLAAGDPQPDVSKMRFPQALKFFESKGVITKPEFNRLSALAKQRSFTVAGVMSENMLATIQAELAKQIAAGSELSDFAKFITQRLKDAGFTATLETGALSASHVETVYRTNVLNAYNAGRAVEMTASIETRPVWEFRVVRDNGTRATHRRVHNVRLLATDPFWRTVYTPMGWNCRCRVISRGPAFLDSVVEGSTIRGLPDRGFTSGIPSLLL